MIAIPNMSKPKSCWECFNADCDHWGEHGYDNLDDCPLIDIVQCKECKWGDTGIDEEGKLFWKCLGIHYGGTKPTDFCSYAERK